MQENGTIRHCYDIIGEGRPDDYVIAPTKHIEDYKIKAPPFAEILKSSEIRTLARRYELQDQDAVIAQKKFKQIFERSNMLVMLTGMFVALLIATAALVAELPDWLEKILLVVFGIGGVISGGIASRDVFIIREGRVLENWMSKRASAETTRLDYFKNVMELPGSSPTVNGNRIELLKLEYFRRFQLEVQLAFYRERGKYHLLEASRTLSYSGWAVAGAAIASGSAGVLGAIQTSYAAIGALGSVFAGLSYYASMREAVSQDRRNAERYARTFHVLEDLYAMLDEVRRAVQDLGMGPLMDFVKAVNEQISLEHRQWLGENERVRDAVSQLQDTLKKFTSEITPTPNTT